MLSLLPTAHGREPKSTSPHFRHLHVLFFSPLPKKCQHLLALVLHLRLCYHTIDICAAPLCASSTMSDNQWRRKLPVARSRTPMFEATEPEGDGRSSSAMATHPPTPKKGLRPKLSSYWTSNGPFGVVKPEPEAPPDDYSIPSFPSWAVEDPFPDPNAEQLIDSIMCRLMTDPYKPLDGRFNGMLLQIFEAYRNVCDERDGGWARLNEEIDARAADKSSMQRMEEDWDCERRAYKAEVKRLELIIAKEKRGVAAVVQARQDSIIRRRKQMDSPDDEDMDDGKETVIQFLEKTRRFEDPAWSSQRGTFGESSPVV
jgi:hypothetical protein